MGLELREKLDFVDLPLHRSDGHKVRMMAVGVMEIDAGADGAVAEVLDAWSSRPFMATCGMATTVTMHHTQSHRCSQRNYEWYREIMYYYSHLFIAFVMGQHNCAIFLGMVTRELRSFCSKRIRKICAQNCRWVSAAFDIY